MRYSENPHQCGVFYGELKKLFEQLNGKELSYNNLVDVDAAIQLIKEWPVKPGPVTGSLGNLQKQRFGDKIPTPKPGNAEPSKSEGGALVAATEPENQLTTVFAIIKHTNVCGIAQRPGV